MPSLREELRSGLDYLEAVTTLMQRVRSAHPTKGLYQAAEIQWWWTRPCSTDDVGQLFWYDDDGPAAAVTVTDFGDSSSLVYDDPTLVIAVLPDATPDWRAHVVERGLAHVAAIGIKDVALEVDREDHLVRTLLLERGFTVKGDAVVECWLDAGARTGISPLHDGYTLACRQDTMDHPHHMARPGRPDFEERLQQLSLYRSDLDLVVFDVNEDPAAHGLFWYDPTTSTGVVEPMRTHDAHQQRGLARHILTTGIELLAKAGAQRISIGYEPDNPASEHLYRSVGFEPHTETELFGGSTGRVS